VEFAAHKIEGETTLCYPLSSQVSSPMDGSSRELRLKYEASQNFTLTKKLCAWNGSRIKEKLQDDKAVLAFWYVDSTVAAVFLFTLFTAYRIAFYYQWFIVKKRIPKRIRINIKKSGLNVKGVVMLERSFLIPISRIQSDPETKRKKS
jgi:hypothetical protein